MALRIETLSADGFRGYSRLRLENLGPLNVFVGPNATGKTNLIEALQLLCVARSFRGSTWGDVVSWGSEQARIAAEFADGSRRIEHVLHVRDGKRSYEINGKRKPSNAIAETCPCVLFTPDDLQLVKGSSAQRRAALDELGRQLSGNFAEALASYTRLLRQRNALLRDEGETRELVSAYDEGLVTLGAHVCASRWRLFDRVAEHMCRVYDGIAHGERLEARYIPSWERFDERGSQRSEMTGIDVAPTEPASTHVAQTCLRELLERTATTQVQRKTTLAGPQKDEMAFFIDGKNARSFASQGQQRTIVLCMKIAEVRVIEELREQAPVLLLDDVMSELDETRRRELAHMVESAAQTFITTTKLDYFESDVLSHAHIIETPVGESYVKGGADVG